MERELFRFFGQPEFHAPIGDEDGVSFGYDSDDDFDDVEIEGLDETEESDLEDDQDNPENSGNSPYSEDYLKTVKGKSADDLIKMLHDSQVQIGKLSQQMGEIKKTAIPERTSTAISKEIKGKETLLNEAKAKLRTIDEDLEPEEYRKAQQRISTYEKQVEALRKESEETRVNEIVEEKFAREHNSEMQTKMRKEMLNVLGLDLSDADFEFISDRAMSLADGKKLTREDFEAALVKSIGVEKYRKILATKGEQKLRLDLKDAKGRTFAHIGKRTNSQIPFSQLTQTEQARRIEGMSDAEFAEFYKKKY